MYNFNLEPVLKHRKLVEENLQKELAVLKLSLVNERKRLQTYKESRSKFLVELHRKQEEGTTISDVFLYLPFIEQLSKDIEKQNKTVSDLEKDVEQKRQDLVEASKKKKTLEKLKDKGLKAYKQEMIKNEQEFLNEVAVNQFNGKIRRER
ncbi:MAG: flagellar export protein FliJ [Desulfobacteraceae bacterium]|nr:MAG: flagellar export protein FliJ [Desulfobacteraceae bacterium]